MSGRVVTITSELLGFNPRTVFGRVSSALAHRIVPLLFVLHVAPLCHELRLVVYLVDARATADEARNEG